MTNQSLIKPIIFNPWIGPTKTGKPCKRTSKRNWKRPLSWDRMTSIELSIWEKIKSQYPGLTDENMQTTHGFIKPCRQPVLCGSRGDVFDKNVPQQWRNALFSLIHATPNIHWLLLTKSNDNANVTDAVCSLPHMDIVRLPPPHPLPPRSAHNGTRN
ncbi:hypothetical protein XF_0483 [Xylella fastidiosa 9a5c]|uniref:DUF5131 family protein n=1 Tax=Xylella fastidiosa (strain 9a5c) TaxID=160492 RepID=Q9PG19_XYLFA|nr:DUF5131 family protein [Xylella fastidiosa]AAF83293.1 hypothetical protein XF_0483 [Xylella fastidiosa 9a5c]